MALILCLSQKSRFSLLNFELVEIILYTLFIALITAVLIGLSFILSPREDNPEKGSSYECGFEPFGDARSKMDIHFYLMGILFLIFDLEVVFLYPGVLASHDIFSSCYLSCLFVCLFFLLLLGLGFVYEWKKRALIWTPSK